MNNYPPAIFAPASLSTGRFPFGKAARPSPLTAGGTLGDLGGTSGGGRQFFIHPLVETSVLTRIRELEALATESRDAEFYFCIMALRERLGLPLEDRK